MILEKYCKIFRMIKTLCEFNKRKGGSVGEDSVDIVRNNEETNMIKQTRDRE